MRHITHANNNNTDAAHLRAEIDAINAKLSSLALSLPECPLDASFITQAAKLTARHGKLSARLHQSSRGR